MVKGALVSIDIGEFKTVILVGKELGGRVWIKQVYMLPTPENSVTDGQIINREVLAAALGAKIREHKLQNMRAVVTISSSLILSKEFILPHIKGNDLETMLQHEIKQYLPIVLNDYVKQHKVIQYLEDASVEKQRVLLSAIPTSIVEEYRKLIEEISLIPYAMDTHSNCIEKLFGEKLLKRKDSVLNSVTKAYIDIGYNSIGVYILRSGMFRYEQHISGGSADITEAITGMGYQPSEIEHIKRQNINLDKGSEDLLSDEALTEAASEIISRWTTELQRSFNLYTTRTPGNTIDEICIFGGGAKLKGLDIYLLEYFKIPVVLIRIPDKVKINMSYAEYISNIVNASGAVIRR